MREIREIGKPPRFFSDDMSKEFTCTCGPQPIDLPGSRQLRREVRSCEVHGAIAHPENWR